METLDPAVKTAIYKKTIDKSCFHFQCDSLGDALLELSGERRQKIVQVPGFLVGGVSHPRLKSLRGISISEKINKTKHRYYGYRYPDGLIINDHISFRSTEGVVKANIALPEKPRYFPFLANYARVVNVYSKSASVCKYLVVGKLTTSESKDIGWDILQHKERFEVALLEGDDKYLPSGFKVANLSKLDGWVCDGYFITNGDLIIESTKCLIKPSKVLSYEDHKTLYHGSKFINVPNEEFPEAPSDGELHLVAYRDNNHLFTNLTKELIYI